MRIGVLLGCVSAILVSCGSDTAANEAPTATRSDGGSTTVVSPTDATDPADSGQNDYDAVLAKVGVVVANAPTAAVVLADAEFCGWDQVGPIAGGSSRVDLAGRRCFVGAHLDGRSALFLVDARTNEGDPTPYIYRTDGGRVTEFADFTRDNYGIKAWRVEPCDTLYFASYDAESPARLAFSCYPWDEGGQL
ncbi:MAG TPA: hypothetical protein PK020_22485 [Ilumatobacteraceae bacterium]|nr:hypothetical protein [Ilumatobacteraceae bacterium]HRB04488.1 hypothetical protein [Ilumatobacteraceae bacterium]